MAFNRGEPPESEGEETVKLGFPQSHSLLFSIKIFFIGLPFSQITNGAYQIHKGCANLFSYSQINKFNKICFLRCERIPL